MEVEQQGAEVEQDVTVINQACFEYETVCDELSAAPTPSANALITVT